MKATIKENDIFMTIGMVLFIVLEFMISKTCGNFYGPLTYSILGCGYASILVASLVSGKTEPTTNEVTSNGYAKTFSQLYEQKISK